MRGKVNFFEFFRCLTRITPAYAGKRELNVTPNRLLGDHPRLCGEKESVLEQRVYEQGSPPPMRGKAHCFSSITSP